MLFHTSTAFAREVKGFLLTLSHFAELCNKSNLLAGFVVKSAGCNVGFLILAAIAVVIFKVFWFLCTETKTKFNRKTSRPKHLAKPQFFHIYHHWADLYRFGFRASTWFVHEPSSIALVAKIYNQ